MCEAAEASLGIMELADLVVVTKCDGALKPVAKAAAQDIRAALSVLRPRDAAWAPRVITSSMHDPGSAAAVADVIEEFRATMGRAGALRAAWACLRADCEVAFASAAMRAIAALACPPHAVRSYCTCGW